MSFFPTINPATPYRNPGIHRFNGKNTINIIENQPSTRDPGECQPLHDHRDPQRAFSTTNTLPGGRHPSCRICGFLKIVIYYYWSSALFPMIISCARRIAEWRFWSSSDEISSGWGEPGLVSRVLLVWCVFHPWKVGLLFPLLREPLI